MDPRRFPDRPFRFLLGSSQVSRNSCNGLPKESLKTISQFTGLDSTKLKAELTTFVRDFPSLTRTLHNEYQGSNVSNEDLEISHDVSNGEDEQTDEKDADELPNPCAGCCKKCLLCCYKILYRFSLNSSSFSNLFAAYEYLLTLSFSQVSCERTFSKLKIVKTRLRSSLGNEKLETFMFMCTETDLLRSIAVDEIISHLVKDSKVYSNLLCL